MARRSTELLPHMFENRKPLICVGTATVTHPPSA